MKKIIFVFLFLCSGVSLAQKETALQQYSRISYKIVRNGEVMSAVCNSKTLPSAKNILKCLNTTENFKPSPISVTFTFLGCTTIFDLLSNGTPQNIVQDPNNFDRIHAVCMSSPWGDPHPNFPGRLIKYYYSTNTGTSWTLVSSLGPRGGFPQITLMANGNTLISGNVGSGSNETAKWYYDAAPGLGSFTELYHYLYQPLLFARTVPTSSITNTIKFISILSSYDLDSAFWIGCTALNPSPGLFNPLNFVNAKPCESYTIGRGDDGRIGIVYVANNLLVPADFGDTYFIETTNQGLSFSSPLKIFDANISSTGDSLGAYRGISMVYQGNSPKVVFDIVKLTNDGSYFPNDGKNHIRFWSTSLPGSDPNRSIKIADTGSVGYHPLINTNTGSNDALTCICRPTIGVSSNGAILFVAFMVPSNHVGGSVDTVSYKDVWFMYSNNNGSNWVAPVKINPVSPIRDWSYPSLSLVNDYTGGNYYANLLLLSDSLPGSYVNFSSNGPSNAKFMFARISLSNSFSISGLVRYSDNNQPATNGYVKAIKLDRNTGNIITYDSVQIQSNGAYTLTNVPQDSIDIGIYPNSTTQNDWVVTYYPSTIYWENAVTLYPTGNLTNINIGAIRMTATTNSNSVNGKVMRLTDTPLGNLKDAVLYAKNGNTFVRCTTSDVNGAYHLNSLPVGNLKIIVNRLGFSSDSTTVNVTSTSNIDSINFYLNRMYVGVKKIGENVPSEYKLYQNYPNPFNPSTIIRFQIKDSRFTTLKIYDILGREVVTLVNEKQLPGVYEVKFDASGLPSGIYFYKLEILDPTWRTQSYKETKRMVLIK